MKRTKAFGSALLMVSQFGCTEKARPADPLALVPMVDVNPAPAIVEVELVAEEARVELLPGTKTDVWAYRDANGGRARVPGPLLEANVGDEVIVHFRNDLPVETTIHWHGVRLPVGMDGSNTSQNPIPPGGTFEYRFIAQDAGSFWFHPHLDADEQIERGLYAPLVVHGGVEPDVVATRYFVLDDVKLEADGSFPQDVSSMDLMVGRQGNVLLANGTRNGTLRVASGTRERWRFVNVANGRFFNLSLPGHSFLVMSWDGGMLPEPYSTDTLLLAPGERYEVLVELAGEVGSELPLETLHYDRGHDLPDPGPISVLTVSFESEGRAAAPLPTAWGSFAPLVDSTAGVAVRPFVLTEMMMGMQDPQFFINGEAWPNVTPTSATFDATEIWEIRNESEMDHPFHLHGTFFQVLDRDGIAETRLGYKDTVLVRRASTLRFAVRYDAPGMWMYHCHILEHAELGMMGSLSVE